MISFACKGIRFEELIRCSFNINKTEYKLLIKLLEQDKEVTVPKMAKEMGMDRSSIQKGAMGLLKKNLIHRRQVNLGKGGYFFFYSAKRKESIKKSIILIIDKWHQEVIKEISEW